MTEPLKPVEVIRTCEICESEDVAAMHRDANMVAHFYCKQHDPPARVREIGRANGIMMYETYHEPVEAKP